MGIHIGKKIREELKRQRFPVTLFAKKINRTRNVAYDIFKRESIDTDLLNKISKVLNCDFFSAYSAKEYVMLENVKTFHEPEAPLYGKHAEEMERLQQLVKAQANEIALLKKINSLLEKKPKGGGKK